MNRADEIASDYGGDSYEPTGTDKYPRTYIVKALLMMVEEDHEKVNDYLEEALKMDPDNLCAILTKACAAYERQNYEEALVNFHQALRLRHSNSFEVIYVGIGMCCIKLKEERIARVVFKRILELGRNQSAGTQARIGLALLELNSMKMTMQMRNEDGTTLGGDDDRAQFLQKQE